MLDVSGATGTLCEGGAHALIVYKENQVRVLEVRLERVNQSDGCDQFQRDNLSVPGSQSEEDLHRSLQRTGSAIRLLENATSQASDR